MKLLLLSRVLTLNTYHSSLSTITLNKYCIFGQYQHLRRWRNFQETSKCAQNVRLQVTDISVWITGYNDYNCNTENILHPFHCYRNSTCLMKLDFSVERYFPVMSCFQILESFRLYYLLKYSVVVVLLSKILQNQCKIVFS